MISRGDRPLLVVFNRLGPYHDARLRAAAGFGPLVVVEMFSESIDYAWGKVGDTPYRRITLFQSRNVCRYDRIVEQFNSCLEGIEPCAVAIPGWWDCEALMSLRWCSSTHTPIIVMSESTAHDDKRVWWKEAIKRLVVQSCDAGLVGGIPHVKYLHDLGMPMDRILTGYDVIDNRHFAQGADVARNNATGLRAKLDLPEHYFLAVARFIPEKNLFILLDAYADYVKTSGGGAWRMVILGDGALRPQLESYCARLGVNDKVLLPGFRQYDELPLYYGLAGAFVHASTVEPWGLVVNEAMASGLPVLVSNRCGCAPDLVKDGVNGFTFDPDDVEALTGLMIGISRGNHDLNRMGANSLDIISRWTPELFGRNIWKTVEMVTTGRTAKRISPLALTVARMTVWKRCKCVS
jgi:glycosyltransferase involved in cell wall biosynthesis